MKKDKLSQIFDFQKFENNEALAFAIRSAQNYAKSVASDQELSEDDLDNLSAAGIPIIKQPKDPKDK